MFKLLAVIGFVAIASAADVIVGRESGKIIFEQNVTASPTIWTQVRNVTVNATNNEVISRVVVIDNRPQKDGEAKIIDGGEGQKNVTIELKSPAVFRGFDFTVLVYAEENSNSQFPYPPKSVGIDVQNPQVPIIKDINLNDDQKNKKENDDDVIIGAEKPVISSNTEASKDNGQVTNPAAVGNDQTRLYRDTKDQKADGQNPLPIITSSTPAPTENVNNENNQQTQEHDKDIQDVLKSIFVENGTQNNEDPQVKVQVQPVTPEHVQNPVDLAQSEDDEEQKQGPEKIPIVPSLNKEFQGHTTAKSIPSGTEHVESKKPLPKDIAMPTDNLSTNAAQMTTEASKFDQQYQQKAVPLPYVKH